MSQIKKIVILGATGSVGQSTLDICRQHPDRFQVVGLAAGTQVELLAQAIREFRPQIVSVSSEQALQKLRGLVSEPVELVCGPEGVVQVASLASADLVVSAIVGAAGLKPTVAAIEAGKDIALANKESMVIAGELISRRAQEKGVKILPVDSEHSAIFQCLDGEHIDDVERLILTASGGPFLHRDQKDFMHITKAEALKHPNWDMGAKITIDSATMMNKGLEVMEARWLFNMPVSKIDVVIHPQSIVHSMVEFIDRSVIAQLGEPDMRAPIAFALSYPRRITTSIKKLDLPQRRELNFFAPDFDKFRCLKLAYDVAKSGGSYAPVLNAANEVAVQKFLNDQIHFMEIPTLVEDCLNKHSAFALTSIEKVSEADKWAREILC